MFMFTHFLLEISTFYKSTVIRIRLSSVCLCIPVTPIGDDWRYNFGQLNHNCSAYIFDAEADSSSAVTIKDSYDVISQIDR